MTTPPEVWVPAFRRYADLTEKVVFGSYDGGLVWCRLCESSTKNTPKARRAHIRQHERERAAHGKRSQREQARQAQENLRLINRERRMLARAGGTPMTAKAAKQTKDGAAPKRGSTKQLMAEIITKAGTALHVNEITARVIKSGKTSLGTSGKTPSATLAAQLSVAAKKGDTFIRVAPATFGLIDGPQDLPPTPEKDEVAATVDPPQDETPADAMQDAAAQAVKATEQAQANGKDVTPDPKPAPTKKPSRGRRAPAKA